MYFAFLLKMRASRGKWEKSTVGYCLNLGKLHFFAWQAKLHPRTDGGDFQVRIWAKDELGNNLLGEGSPSLWPGHKLKKGGDLEGG
jgi:hypothetical protein